MSEIEGRLSKEDRDKLRMMDACMAVAVDSEVLPDIQWAIRKALRLGHEVEHLKRERDEATQYANHLLDNFSNPPSERCDTVAGMLTQIDNCIVGERDKAFKAGRAEGLRYAKRLHEKREGRPLDFLADMRRAIRMVETGDE